jgi:hypothetical protein
MEFKIFFKNIFFIVISFDLIESHVFCSKAQISRIKLHFVIAMEKIWIKQLNCEFNNIKPFNIWITSLATS